MSFDARNNAGGSAAISVNEVDYYRFQAPTTGTYVVSASTPSSSVDTVIGVYNTLGYRLNYNDDLVTYVETDSRMPVTLLANQVYYLAVSNYTGSPTGAYNWAIDGPGGSPPADDVYEHNDVLASSYALGAISSTRTISNLALADGNDWFRFQIPQAGTTNGQVRITFQQAQGDLAIELYRSNITFVGRSDTVLDGEQLSLNNLAAGTYYLRVYGYLGAFNPNYTLTITPPSGAVPPPTGGGGAFQITISFGGGLTASQQAAFQQAAARWQRVIVGDLPNMNYGGLAVDDVLIVARGRAIDGRGGILGQAGPDAFRPTTFLPYHGVMEFDSADLASMEQAGRLVDVITHEMGHVLGIGTIWDMRGLLWGSGTTQPLFIGPNAIRVYNQIFGRVATGVPLENSGGPGTREGHWRESVFGNELMTGYLNSGTNNPLSAVTVASMADLGYVVNMGAGEPYAPLAGHALTAGGTSGQPALTAEPGQWTPCGCSLCMGMTPTGGSNVEHRDPLAGQPASIDLDALDGLSGESRTAPRTHPDDPADASRDEPPASRTGRPAPSLLDAINAQPRWRSSRTPVASDVLGANDLEDRDDRDTE